MRPHHRQGQLVWKRSSKTHSVVQGQSSGCNLLHARSLPILKTISVQLSIELASVHEYCMTCEPRMWIRNRCTSFRHEDFMHSLNSLFYPLVGFEMSQDCRGILVLQTVQAYLERNAHGVCPKRLFSCLGINSSSASYLDEIMQMDHHNSKCTYCMIERAFM